LDSLLHFEATHCFVTIQAMQSIDTQNHGDAQLTEVHQTFDAGRVEDLPEGSCKTIELSAGRELALYHINGEFYATENFCPHKGAPLAAGKLCDHVIECDWHGWQVDVRTGECLTVTETIETYEVLIEDGLIKLVI
jgi:nitrite reductase/ring-hydroxylating ferredoxin subunit